MLSPNRPYVYIEVLTNYIRIQALVVYAVEETLRALLNLNQLNAVSTFKSGQLELLTGQTFYPNRTTERLVAARRRRLIR